MAPKKLVWALEFGAFIHCFETRQIGRMVEIAGKTAFVTGAASCIGLGIATALAQAGVKVMLCDLEEAALAKAVADLKLTNAERMI